MRQALLLVVKQEEEGRRKKNPIKVIKKTLLPVLLQRRGWRKLSPLQIYLHWSPASQEEPWPPSPARLAGQAPALLAETHKGAKFIKTKYQCSQLYKNREMALCTTIQSTPL